MTTAKELMDHLGKEEGTLMTANIGKLLERVHVNLQDERDFTVRIEVRGDKGRLIHVRVDSTEIDRPMKKI